MGIVHGPKVNPNGKQSFSGKFKTSLELIKRANLNQHAPRLNV